MSRHTDEEIERTRAAVIEAREQALQAKADAVRIKARNKADNIRRKAETKAKLAIAKGEARAARLEGIAPAEVERKIRLDVHGRPKPAMRGWIHLVAAPLSLAAGIVLICLAQGAALKWACAVFMVCSLVLFANSAAYHLGDWSPRVTDVLRRIDHLNIFLLIVGMFIEGNASMIILVPLLHPIAMAYGINEIQFAMTYIFNNAIGALSPPMGTLMFVTCGITGCKTGAFIKEAVPFYILLVINLLLITYVPVFSTGILALLGN